ncbi:MAG TPA: hypothetical protein VFV38_28505 [Ktedonobacteraceae bacterium]|nr:hypothetical protein [Ktedonobacteraceae bacterium]
MGANSSSQAAAAASAFALTWIVNLLGFMGGNLHILWADATLYRYVEEAKPLM